MKTRKEKSANKTRLFGLAVFTASTLALLSAPVQWSGNGHFYDGVEVPTPPPIGGITWSAARDAASSMSFMGVPGHLVTITSQAENDFLCLTFPQSGQFGHEYWLGGFQNHANPAYSEPAGGWEWVTGEPFTFTNWYPGEPNNGGGEDSLQFFGLQQTWQWNDRDGNATLPGYLVEFEVTCRSLYHFDEASGTTAIDSCDGWNGTLQNGATRQPSSPFGGSSLSLDGIDDYVSIPAGMLNNLPQGTVEANIWVESFVPNISDTATPIVSKGDTTLTELVLAVGPDAIAVAGGQSLDGLTVPVHIPLRTWTKVAVSWDGSMRKLYVNDMLVGQDSSPFVPPNNDSNPVQIGRHNHIQGPFYFHGFIDEVRVSNFARTFDGTACEAVEALILTLEETDIARKNKRPMIVTLKAACGSFDRGQVGAGINQLQAFQNKVRAQVAPTDREVADMLTRTAQQIIDAVTSQ